MERFQFRVPPSDLDSRTVQFEAYSSDKYARHKLIGETELRLGDIDLRQAVRVWMCLHDMDQVFGTMSPRLGLGEAEPVPRNMNRERWNPVSAIWIGVRFSMIWI